MHMPVQLIVGLGNPGPDYQNTRHNAGADFVSALAGVTSTVLQPTAKFFGLTGRADIAGHDVKLLIPTTYMNRSGQAVAAISQFYKIPPAAILVAHDELDLPPGSARLKMAGGHGGHNGLRDIISALGNDNNFGRLRLGIGHPGDAKQVVGYVLKKAPRPEQEQIEAAIEASVAVMAELAKGEWERAMNRLHSHKIYSVKN